MTVDAIYFKPREKGRIFSKAFRIAYATNSEEKRARWQYKPVKIYITKCHSYSRIVDLKLKVLDNPDSY